MGIRKVKVSTLARVGNILNFIVLGVDNSTGKSAIADMEQLRGNTGLTPDITVKMKAVAYGTPPSVSKTGTNENPTITISFPLAKNGDTPRLQVSGDFIQYRYTDTDEWQNLVDLDTLRLHFTDLTPAQIESLKLHFSDLSEEEIAQLRKPADDAAKEAKDAADRLNDLSDHPAEIREGYWWQWNEETGEYENTGERADGNTLFATFDIDLATGELSMTTPDRYDGAQFALDNNGNLTVEI